MTRFPEIFRALAEPFSPEEVKSRTQAGRVLYYVTATTVANRLDSVLGPEAWDLELAPWGEGALIGTLIVRLPDGTTVRKSNVGGRADMAAADDDAKSAASDCLKRCATLLGVARYLYRDGVPNFVTTPTAARVEVPAVEAEATPTPTPEAAAAVPTSARAFYMWVKSREVDHPGLMGRLAKWAEARKMPVRILAWDRAMIEEAYGNILEAIAEGHIPPTAIPAPTRVNGAYPRPGRNGKS
jgi:hypothetical protein